MSNNSNTHGGARAGSGRKSFASRNRRPLFTGPLSVPGASGAPHPFFQPRNRQRSHSETAHVPANLGGAASTTAFTVPDGAVGADTDGEVEIDPNGASDGDGEYYAQN